MAEAQDPIIIDVEFAGAQQASEKLGQVARGLGQVDTAADAAGTATSTAAQRMAQMATSGQTAAQRIQGMAGAVQQLVSVMGSTDRTAGLVSSVAGATAQFAAMGSMLGPAGTVIGGLAGLVVGLQSVVAANNDVEATARAAATALQTLAAQRISDRERAEFETEISGGAIRGDRSASSIELAAEERRIERERLRTEMEAVAADRARATATFEGAGRSVPEDTTRALNARRDAIRDEYRELGEEVETLEGELSRRAAVAREAERARAAAAATPTRRGGGRGTGAGGMSSEERSWLDDVAVAAAMAEEEQRIAAETAEALERIKAEQMERERAANEERLAEQQKLADEELAIWEHQSAEMERLGREQETARREADASALEDRQQMAGELTGLLGQTTAALGKAVGSIILGEKSTEEAFRGLAAAFLEMISQYASLKAATEFADAAASFARYDFGGGAAHVGAGLAFTAVAVATGIGAAAINAPPQSPARPEAGQQPTEGGGGGDVIINWNSPVVTAVTRAELGRDISGLVAEAGAI